ncbi:MAG: hypothetical protein L6R39_000495 [Caloplaca ligustica]|nr:MAG: hypothetical protein L6R39_000495 [Caloplaca ligustica]
MLSSILRGSQLLLCTLLFLKSVAFPSANNASPQDWQRLKRQLNGNLQPARPLAYSCFPHAGSSDDTAHTPACTTVQENYLNASYRSSLYPGFFHTYNDGCVSNATDRCLLSPDDPSAQVEGTCSQGLVSDYYIEIESAQDVQTAFDFARHTGVALSLKASGHDYLGRSSIKGSLALWTRTLKEMTYHASFSTGNRSSVVQAVTLGAGVNLDEAYTFADQNNVTLIGGSSSTVTVSGGWTLFGGHSVLSPLYGMGVDRVLEFTIVTPDGILRTANAQENTRLFWALRGAGGAAFGVVLSTTIKVEPAMPLTVATISFPPSPTNQLPFLELLINESVSWAAEGWGGPLGSSYAALVHPGLLDLNATARTFSTIAEYARGQQQPQQPSNVSSSTGNSNGTASSTAPSINFLHFPTWRTFYEAIIEPSGNPGVGQTNFVDFRVMRKRMQTTSSGRKSLSALFRSLLAKGLQPQILQTPPHLYPNEQGSTSVHPAWRDSFWMVGTSLQYAWNASEAESQGNATLLQQVSKEMVAAAPDGAHYPNEADPWLDEWQKEFWGENYARLMQVKKEYDPQGLIGCWKCVGYEAQSKRGGEDFSCWQAFEGLA